MGKTTGFLEYDRIEEGYGLNMDAITNLQRTSDITLIITVDCGITAIDETNYALQRGIDMVITDHHECKSELPQAAALVDPHRKDQPQPVTEMAGVGVELDAIASVVIGGTSLMGGYGRIGGTIIGSIIMGILINGLVLMNVSAYYQQIITGLIIVLAVAFDTYAKSRRGAL